MLAIVVSHPHLVGRAIDLRFIPSLETTALMLRDGLLLRHTSDGAELWCDAAQASAAAQCVVVLPRNARLESCTHWPVARPLRYVCAAGEAQMQPETLAGSGASRRPLLTVEIDHRPAPDGACVLYRIALAAKWPQ
jgi:hypothetical protein